MPIGSVKALNTASPACRASNTASFTINCTKMIRPILRYGKPRLKTRADEITEINQSIKDLVVDMTDTMYAAKGIGLAAPQIDVGLRIFVIDTSSGQDQNDFIAIANPQIIDIAGIQQHQEGCLSVPGFEESVERAAAVTVRGLDLDGNPIVIEGKGLLARAFQHEMDHLDGVLYVDHLSGMKRDVIVRRINKLKKTGHW